MVNARANQFKLWPHMTVVFLVCAALGGVAAALWMRHEPRALALALPHAARVERVDGEVGLSRDLDADASDAGWVELTPNTPLTEGDRLYAREDSRASLAFTGRNFARLEPDSSLDVLSLSDRRTQLALRQGSAIFDLGALGDGEMFEVATPYGAVDFREPGLYEMGYNDDGSAFVSVLSGLAQVVGLAGSGQVSKGEMLTLLGQTAAQVALSRLSPDYAGGLLDDYYGYRYPDQYDGRYNDYDAYLNDPYYYDPYNRHVSYRHVPASVPGAYDLDYYGDWQNLDGYGTAWSPRVEPGWAPYRDGRWVLDDPYGLTWVSNEPWGYAPYHYGRWASVGDRWYWIPDGANAQPAYAPALVAFLPVTGANQVGWVPLAPGDPYAPAYYDANWQPHYVGGDYYAPERVVNLGVPGGLTVVSVDDFGRRINPDALARFDPSAFEGARPLKDPLSHAALRQMSLTRAIERRGFVLPPGLAKRLEGTQVYASAPPAARPFRDDPGRRLRVAAVPEKQKREKLKFKDERREPEAQAAGRVFQEARRATRDAARAERRQGKAERDARAQPKGKGKP
ncbi:MAG: FecR domain-containing protein [Acidobacteria bacterium]|nr:FecR domain-containing protein [Acidobacteriota bacterium]